MEQSINNSVNEELKIKTTDEEPFNICLTNNYAFLKIFKKEENVKGFLIDLLNLKYNGRRPSTWPTARAATTSVRASPAAMSISWSTNRRTGR